MKKYVIIASFLTSGLVAMANSSIAPSGTSLTTLSAATFGGTGIPNDAVEVTTLTTANQNQITLGLTATPRYNNPSLGNDNAGTFFATPGANDGLTSPGHSIAGTWNFDFYINLTDTSGTGYGFKLIAEDNTTGSTTVYDFGTFNASTTKQDSQNIAWWGFDPNATDVYGFDLEALNGDGVVLGSTAINVDVATVPDGSNTVLLLGLGFAGLVVFGYRQNRLAFAK
jgi:hypothetical protein